MKTYHLFVSALALCAAAIACQKQEEKLAQEPLRTLTFHATGGESTKTVLQADGSIFWSPGDAINLFCSNASGRFETNITEVAARADFSGSPEGFSLDGNPTFWAAYPYSAGNSFDGSAVTLSLPETQEAVAGSFANNLFPALAKSTDNNLHFYNVGGGVKFSVDHEGITSVVFKGNNGEVLAGQVKVGFDNNGKPQVQEVLDGKTEIRLRAPTGSSFQPGQWYYIVTLPAVLDEGYTLSFFRDAPLGERTSAEAVSIKRSVWGALTLADGDIVEDIDPEAVDMGLSVKWASFNLGTDSPAKAASNHLWGPTDASVKYNSQDGKILLDPEDDAATVALGGLWRTPTQAEWEELIRECEWTRSLYREAPGYQVKSPSTGNTLFVSDSFYWTACLDEYAPEWGILACIAESEIGAQYFLKRSDEASIRAIQGALFRFSPSRADLSGEETSFTVEVVSSLGYKTSNVPAWIQAVSVEKAGLNRFIHTFKAAANEGTEARRGVIVFCNDNNTCVPFSISQEANPVPVITPEKTTLIFTRDAGETSIGITADSDWTATSDQPWCTVSPESGSGNGNLSVRVEANETDVVRSARITLASTDGRTEENILVSQAETIVEPDFDWSQTFSHRSLMMRFTATWCGWCPLMAHAVDYAQQNYPGLFEAVNLHGGQSDLEFSGTNALASQYKIQGYPSGIVDGRRSVDNYEYTYTAQLIAQYAHETEDNYPLSSGIRYESAFEGSALNIDLTLYLRYAGDYKVTVLLLEDKIEGNQTEYTDDATIEHTDYIHNAVARMAISDISGDAFTTAKDCVAKKFNYSVKVVGNYKRSRLRILVYVQRAYGNQKIIRSGNYGDYYVDNAISGKAGADLPLTVK